MSLYTEQQKKAKIINEAFTSKKTIYGRVNNGPREGTIGILFGRKISATTSYSMRHVRIAMRIEGRRDCSYKLTDIDVLENYTGETVFVENKPEPQQIDVFDFLGQKITTGSLVFFSRGNDAIMAVVKELLANGRITVRPIKINDKEYKQHSDVRLNVTDRVLTINKGTLDAAMMLKLRI